LNLGRTPIREAIKQLQAESLVTVTPRRGMYVADIAVTDLTQLFEVRASLECLAVRLATQRITDEQLSELRHLAEEYQNTDPGDNIQLIEMDSAFHALIAEAANNKFLSKDLERYYNLYQRIWYIALNYAQSDDLDVHAHIEILEAIEEGDAQRAEQRMKTHVEEFHHTIKQYL
jgi:DNA-binding GntR family transcriptional regulator